MSVTVYAYVYRTFFDEKKSFVRVTSLALVQLLLPPCSLRGGGGGGERESRGRGGGGKPGGRGTPGGGEGGWGDRCADASVNQLHPLVRIQQSKLADSQFLLKSERKVKM